MSKILFASALMLTFGTASASTLFAQADARLASFFQSTNYDNEYLSVYSAANSKYTTVIQFDYSSLAGQTLASAKLQLYGFAALGGNSATSIDVYRVTKTWLEDQVTWLNYQNSHAWDNPGGDAVGTTGNQLTDPYSHWEGNNSPTETWVEIDVTSVVQGAIDGDYANNGLLLKGALGNEFQFVSSEGDQPWGGNGSNTPRLVVETVPEPASFLVLGLGGLLLRRRKKSA